MHDTRAVPDTSNFGGLHRWLAALSQRVRRARRSRLQRCRPIPAIALQALEPRRLLSATLFSSSSLPDGDIGLELNGARGQQRISDDGRFIVFSSTGTGLAANDTNESVKDVFLHDRLAGTTTLLSRNATGGSGDAASLSPVISADGRFVVFESDAGDLVAGDDNGTTDLFLFDRLAGTLTLVSRVAGFESTPNGPSFAPSISADGAFIAFASEATDLVAGATNANGTTDIYLFDRSTGLVTLVSHADGASAVSGAGESYNASISADGNWIVYESMADDLAAADANAAYDVFLYERGTGTNLLVSTNLAGTGSGNRHSFNPVVSADGGVVAFESYASDLTGDDTNGSVGDVFLFDRVAGTMELVSRDLAGGSGDADSWDPILSADGSVVVFESFANDLSAGTDANAQVDVFAYDRGTQSVTLVSAAGGNAGNEASFDPSLSRDGRYIVFSSFACDFVAEGEDENDTVDVYLFDRLAGGGPGLISANRAATGSGNGDSYDAQISGDGSYIVFTSAAPDLVESEAGAGLNVFGVHTTPVVWIEPAQAPETDGPTTLEFTVRRSHSGTAAAVQYWTLDEMTTAGSDYVPIRTDWIEWGGGGSLSATISVQINGDQIVEYDEVFHVELLGIVGATIAPYRGWASGMIVNDDFGIVELVGVQQHEGTGGLTPFTFLARLSHAVQGEVTVAFATADGMARAGSDYVARSGRLYFTAASPGETRAITILVYADDRPGEEEENFWLGLTGSSHPYVAADDIARATILDDDSPQRGYSSGSGGVMFQTDGPMPVFVRDGRLGLHLFGVSSSLILTSSSLEAANGLPVSGRQVPALTSADAGRILDAAKNRLRAAGVPRSAIASLRWIKFNFAYHSGAILSASNADTIYLDPIAAGYGWFVDATPTDDAEYAWRPTSGWRAVAPDAVRGIDLLSVLVYELSHQLGGIDFDPALDPQHWMARTLQPGRRRLPSAEDLAEVFGDAEWFGGV